MEWLPDVRERNLIEQTALRHGIPGGKPVRAGAMTLGHRVDASPPATVSSGHASLTETICRSVHLVATLKRKELRDPGRGADQFDLVATVRRTMNETLDGFGDGALHKGIRKRG